MWQHGFYRPTRIKVIKKSFIKKIKKWYFALAEVTFSFFFSQFSFFTDCENSIFAEGQLSALQF
jgi:hypothetical protein